MCTTLSPQSVFFEIAALSGYIILAAEVLLCASDHIRKTVKIRNGSVYSFIFLHWALHSRSSTARCISRITTDLPIIEIPKSFIRTQLLGVAVLKSKHNYHFSGQPFMGIKTVFKKKTKPLVALFLLCYGFIDWSVDMKGMSCCW